MGVAVEEVEVFEEVVWAVDFEAVDFEVELVVLEAVDEPVEFHLGGLDQQELFQDHQVDLIDTLIIVHVEDIMDMECTGHGIGDGGIPRCGQVIIIDLGIIHQCIWVEESLLR